MTSDIERRIASAYSDLGPSAAVEEAVRAGLSSERAGPARPRGVAWLLPGAAVLALGVALALRGGGEPGLAGEGEAAPDLPAVARPPGGVASKEEESARVHLRRDGRILVPDPAAKPEAWREVTLAQLAERLDEAAREFDRRETAAGRSGYETTPTGAKASRLRLDLLVDRDVPWRHVQWVMTVCAEKRMPRLVFAVRAPGAEASFGLDAPLPTDLGLLAKPPTRVAVLVRAGRYVIDDEECEDLASLARRLAAAREAAGGPVRGEIRAEAGTAFSAIATLLAEFRKAGYEHVDFHGTMVPDADTRKAKELPPVRGR